MDGSRTNSSASSSSERPSQVTQIELLLQEVRDEIEEIRRRKIIDAEFLDRIQRRLDLLKNKCSNLQAIEKEVDAIRDELLSPVEAEIGKGKKFSVLGFWVGAIGIVVSIAALIVSAFLTQSTKETVRQAVERLESEQTYYLGAFPDNMDEIVRLMKNTDESFAVVADHAAYGFFSAPAEFEEYRVELNRLAQDANTTVSIRCYGVTQNPDEIEKQFASSFGNNPQAIASSKKGQHFQDFHPEKWEELNEATDMATAVNWFVERDKEFIRELEENGVFPSYIGADEKPPVYAWIRDGKEAVFSFDGVVGEAEEVAFLTKDPDLIKVLNAIAEVPEQTSSPRQSQGR